MPDTLQVYPSDEYAQAIKARVWALKDTLSLKSCQQVLDEEGVWPIDTVDDTPLAGVISKGWTGDREGGIPALSGPLTFVVRYGRTFPLDAEEETVVRGMDQDLRTIAKQFSLADWSLPGFTAPQGWRHRRIHPVRIEITVDSDLIDLSARFVAGEVELRAIGDSFPIST